MASLDPAVAVVLDRADRDRRQGGVEAEEEEDEDALISALEEEDDTSLNAFREQRLQQLHNELARAKAMRRSDFGTYTEIKDEKQVMDITTSTKLCVVHFMKPDFARCRLMDQKLEALAPKHFDTRFISINVENAPFLVTKLKIQVLPCVLCFVDGVAADRIIGFEGIGYRPDSFTLRELEARLLRTNVILRSKMADEDEYGNPRASQTKAIRESEADDDGDDWD